MDWLKIVVASLMRQIEKLNKKKADRSDVERLEQELPEGIPEGYTAHQQLVTDADGNTTWEERLGYNELSYIEHAEVSVGIYNLGYANLPYELFLANGEQYAINWDGTEYTCTAAITTVDEEEVMVIGNTTFFGGSANTDIPVGIISRSGRATVYSNTSGEHTIGLTGYEPIPHKIPREYIDLNPIVGVIDSSYYNYRYLNPARGASITEVRKAAVNGDRDIIIRLDLDNWQGTLKYMGLTNVSTDGTNYVSALLFSTIKANNVTINASDEVVNGTMQLEYWYALLEPTEGPPSDAFVNFQFAEINLAPGASRAGSYMRVNEDGFWEATEGPTNVSELANDADYISAPATATVGQTIIVKSVDENGKPTVWEAADIGGLIVTMRNPGTDTASCDKTSVEIAEAAKKGIPVIGHIIELDDSGVEQMRIANFAGLWDNGTPETIGAFFYDMRLANGFKTWGDNLSLKVLEVTPDATVSYCGGSAFTAQTT